MAGANYVLDKGYVVLATYNSSAAAGALAYRCVTAAAATNKIDLQATATNRVTGILQESVDAAKIATGKVVADVRLLGISKVRVAATPGTIVIGSIVAASTAGGVKLGVSTNIPVGIVVGPNTIGTPADGDLIDVLLTPGLPALA
jgi:hypothetical protein